MSAYVIFDVDIWDMEQYQKYMTTVKPAIEAAGGKYLVRGGAFKVYEGDWQPRRLVLFEFASMQAITDFFESPLYARIKPLRDACSSARAISVEGV